MVSSQVVACLIRYIVSRGAEQVLLLTVIVILDLLKQINLVFGGVQYA